jgi:hypothetical protein
MVRHIILWVLDLSNNFGQLRLILVSRRRLNLEKFIIKPLHLIL